MAIGLKIKHSTGEITTGTGNLTLNATGNLVLDYATFPSADGTSGQILKTDGAGNLSWAADSGGPADTDALSEGITNLYFTNARADARITNAGSANWNTAFGWGDHGAAGYYSLSANSINDTHIDWGTGSNQVSTADIPESTNLFYTDARADARITNAGSANWNTAFGWGNHASGGYLTSVGALTSHTDVTISGPSSGQHLTYNGAAWVNATVSAASAAGSDTYVQFNDGGNMGADAGLTYAKATDTLTAGTFTTSGASPTLTAAAAMAITTTASNGDITITPHGSGDIILDGQKWPQADGSANQILKTNGAGQLSWTADAGGIALTDLSVTTASAGTASLAYNNGSGVFTFTPPNLSSYLTSIAANSINDTHIDWGTGSGQVSTADVPEQTNLYYTDARADARITNAGSANWNTAYTHAVSAHAPSGAQVNEYSYKTIAISGQTDVVADTTTDTLTFVAGGNMTLTTSGDTITFAAAGGGSQNVFSTIAVSGQSNVVADATTDTLTLVAGSNVTLTTNAGADSVTIAASGGGGGTVDYEEFKCNYHTDGTLLAASNLSSGISSVTIDSAAGGDVTITFTGYTTPPIGFLFYGYGYASNVYNMNTLGSTGTTLRELPGGGSSGSPTAFGSFASLKLRIREAETGASRTFGSTTHAWIRFVMGA